MKKTILILLAVFSMQLLQAQINAITESGDEVILYENGTWKYLNDSIVSASEIPMNEQIFTKPENSSFLVKSKRLNIGIWINPKKWKFSKGGENDDAEFLFEKKDDDFYGMFISEKLSIPIESLRSIAISNARNAAPDLVVEEQEYRMVNGLKVLRMQMSGTMHGLRFTYYGYYYSNENGTIQLVSYSGEDLLKENKDVVESFVNGLVEL